MPTDLATVTTLDLVGMAGVVVYLLAYALLQFGFVRGQTYVYASLSIVAACLVLIGLQRDFNLAAAAIQVSMIAISIAGILRLYIRSITVRFSPEERDLLDRLGLDLPDHLARTLLNAGIWTEGAPGTVLTTEGEPVAELVVLASGEAAVSIEDEVVAICRPPCFIGEMSCLEAAPASATVVLTGESRCFGIGAARLRRLLMRRPDLDNALRASFSRQIGNRLQVSNAVVRRLMSERRDRSATGAV